MRRLIRTLVVVAIAVVIVACVLIALRTGWPHVSNAGAGAVTNDVSPDMRVRPVSSFDASRFAGEWYEIARYPNFFERRCAHGTRIEYAAQPNGQIRVINRCFKSDGSGEVAIGHARRAGERADSARYKAHFGPDWLDWVPWLWGDFWVIVLDPEYQYAAIGGPDREHLWILSRTPTLDVDTYHQIIAQLRAQGFDVDKLERTPQP